MARRNVDLVISAKDDAAKVLDQITAALNEFSDASRGVSGSAEKTESSLGQLGAAVSSLRQNFDTLKIADKLGDDLQSAATKLARFEGELEESQAAARELEKDLDRAGAASKRFDDKLEGATKALKNQKGALKEARADQRALAGTYREAEAAQAKLIAKQQRLPQAIEKQSQAVSVARARYADLQDEIRGTEKPTATLVARFEAAERSLTSKQAKLNKLTTEYSEIGGRINAAGSAMAIFATKAGQAADKVTRQERALDKISENLQALKSAATAAGNENNKLAGRVAKANAAITKQEQVVAKAEQQFVQFAAGLGQADAALADLGSRSLGALEETLRGQRKAALESKKEFTQLTAEAKELAAAMKQADGPTDELQAAFNLVTAKAKLAKAEYIEQKAALELMGRAFRDAGTDITSITTAQERFQSALNGTDSELKQFAANTERAEQKLNELNTAANRAAGGVNRVAGATDRAGRASGRAATETGRLAAAYRQFYGDSRRSLSLLQRIRGEVLSLVAAYGGLFAVIETLKGTVDAYQQLEAAQARLTVATGGDVTLAANELDFLRRTADRLGIQFGVLATEYSKFSIATQGTNLEGAATREIFVSVAEAARVNRTSVKEMSGVFVALTQIVSKGAVQMEELRQQLGDRLPGAIQLMADGLGVGTDELIKMMEQGEVTSDALLPFARELQERFGPGLNDALASTSTAIGRLANEAFEALLRFGQAGFLESFTNLANSITSTLQTAEFQDFAARVSSALAKVVDAVAFAIENFQIFFTVLVGFATLRITPIFVALAGILGTVGRTAVGTTASFTALQARAAAMGVTVTRTTFILRNMRRALLLLLGTTGIGLLVAAIGSGIAYWATSGTDATAVMIAHEKQVDAVKNAYDATGRSVADTVSLIKDLNSTDAARNLRELQEVQKEALASFNEANNDRGSTFATRFFGINLVEVGQEYQDAVDEVIRSVNAGEVPLSQLVESLDAVNSEFRDGSDINARYGEALIDAAKDIEKNAEAIREAELVYQVLTGTLEEKQAALEELSGSLKESAADTSDAEKAANDYRIAMEGVNELLPQVKQNLDFIEKSAALEKLTQDALNAARTMGEVNAALENYRRTQAGLDNAFITGGGSLVDRIIGVESGGRADAKNDKSTATGLGQFIETTWLRMFKQYFPGEARGLSDDAILELRKDADFSRQMVQLYLQENAANLRKMGQDVNDANLYLSHFLGPGGANALLGSAPGTMANDVLGADQIASNRSILDGKTREEVIAWAQQKVGISQTELSVLEQQNRIIQRQRDEQARAAKQAEEQAARERQSTQDRLSDNQFEIEQEKLKAEGKERQAAIEAAIREAKKENKNIDKESLDAIIAQTSQLFDLEQARKNAGNESKAAKEAEEEVNRLISIRGSLLDQIRLAQQSGDTDQIENLRLRVGEVNAEIQSAIDNAIRMWEAVGGSESQAAIEQLKAAKLEAAGFGQEAGNTYLQWERVGDLIVNGVAGAFDKFAQAVANGEDATKAAQQAFLQFAADFLREIAMMIIKQAIFNALKAAFGGTPFGGLIGVGGVGVGHTGGLVGSSRVGSGNSTRRVSPAMFAGAQRYHQGGQIGLRPGEVPIIAKQGEEMLTRDDPRHMLNGGGQGGGGGGKKPMTIINTFDPAEAVERALSTPRGEEVLVNAVRARRTEVKAALE